MRRGDYKITTVSLDKDTEQKIKDLMEKNFLDPSRGTSAIIRKAVAALHEQEFEKQPVS